MAELTAKRYFRFGLRSLCFLILLVGVFMGGRLSVEPELKSLIRELESRQKPVNPWSYPFQATNIPFNQSSALPFVNDFTEYEPQFPHFKSDQPMVPVEVEQGMKADELEIRARLETKDWPQSLNLGG